MDLDLVGCVETNHPHIYIRLLFVLSTCNCREHVSVHYIESWWRCCPFSLTRVIISKVEWRACNGSQLLKSPPPLLHPLPPHSCPTMYSLDNLPLLRSWFYTHNCSETFDCWKEGVPGRSLVPIFWGLVGQQIVASHVVLCKPNFAATWKPTSSHISDHFGPTFMHILAHTKFYTYLFDNLT